MAPLGLAVVDSDRQHRRRTLDLDPPAEFVKGRPPPQDHFNIKGENDHSGRLISGSRLKSTFPATQLEAARVGYSS